MDKLLSLITVILSQCVYIYIKHQVVHLKYDVYMSKISLKLFTRESRWKQIGDKETTFWSNFAANREQTKSCRSRFKRRFYKMEEIVRLVCWWKWLRRKMNTWRWRREVGNMTGAMSLGKWEGRGSGVWVERLALEKCVESSSNYSQGCEDVRADVGRQRDVMGKSMEIFFWLLQLLLVKRETRSSAETERNMVGRHQGSAT